MLNLFIFYPAVVKCCETLIFQRIDDKSGGGVGGNIGGKKKQNDLLRDVFVKYAQPVVQQQQQQENKDNAYAQFMAEMEKMM